ncbi:UNVERIFIED_CONTAM: hypothetical protein HDU68_009971 [Siphonaria sp. JEL0065]|nr:hypothetical protein HDU68_009971 [Siphonaria sp. JEL0065]
MAQDSAFDLKNVDPDVMDGFLRSRTNIYFQASSLMGAVAESVTVKGVIESCVHVECACVELYGALNYMIQLAQASRFAATEGIELTNDDIIEERPTSDATLVSKAVERRQIPWYLKPDHTENDLILDTNGTIIGGTLEALIAKLTSHEEVDIQTIQYIQTFLLGYRGFTNSSVFIQHLIQRFKIQAPHKLSAEKLQEWVTEKRDVIRRRVVDILEVWLERYYTFTVLSDSRAVSILNRFIISSMRDLDLILAQELQSTIAHCLERSSNFDFDSEPTLFSQVTSSDGSNSVTSPGKRDFFEFSAVDIAKELTRIAFEYFGKIGAQELIDKTVKESETPNIKSLLKFSKQVTGWVTMEVLSKQNVEERKVVVERFILVAKACKDYQNYSSLFAVIEALESASVRRLEMTWSNIDSQAKIIFNQLRTTTGTDYTCATYKNLLQLTAEPCIPHMDIVLSDLSTIHAQTPDKLQQTENPTISLINFTKYSKFAVVLSVVVDSQQRKFGFEKSDEIHDFLASTLKIRCLDSHNLFSISLDLEQ